MWITEENLNSNLDSKILQSLLASAFDVRSTPIIFCIGP